MTVSTEPVPLSYSGDGATVDFAITWKYFAKSDVRVTHRSAAGVETTWVLTTNFTLTDADVDAGGTLTAVTAPASGTKITIDLDTPNTQPSSIPLGGDLPSDTIEDALDRLTQLVAKNEQLFNRALRVPITDTQTGSLLELAIDSSRASKYLAFDADGKPIASAGPTGDSSIPVSAFIETLLDDTTAAVARTTLGAGTATVGVTAAAAVQVDQAVTATTRAATTTLGTSLNHTLSDSAANVTAFNGVAGVTYHCRALGAGNLVHHATDLIITQGLATRATAAGDTWDVEMITATTCRVKNYQRADGAPISVATQADMEAASSIIVSVTPGRQHNHPSSAKWWLDANTGGGIIVGYNVASVTDTATGRIAVTIATDFSSADWMPFGIGAFLTTGDSIRACVAGTPAAGSAEFMGFNNANALADPERWYLGGFGDQ